jgi:[ribosomal protein S5]-alanine N-acetyltransferase
MKSEIVQKKLISDRLILRPFGLSDAKRVQELAGDKSIYDTTESIPHPYKDGIAEEWISTHPLQLQNQKHISYAICLKNNELLIGDIGLVLEIINFRSEVGYWVGKKYWGQGYATEALATILEFAKDDLKLNKVIARHLTRNPASGKVMQKNNFIHKCCLEKHTFKCELFEDVELYEKLL